MATTLAARLALAVRYLGSAIKRDGRFIYCRSARSGMPAKGAYNLVRHAGSVLSLLEHLDDLEASLAARPWAALDYLSRFVVPFDGGAIALVEGDRVKLGGAALYLAALVAALEREPRSADAQTAEQLARHLVSQQQSDGSFVSIVDRNGRAAGFVSLYYPGEAILALVRAWRHFRRDEYLQCARRGAAYLARRYTRLPIEELPADHWFLIAASELIQATGDDRLLPAVVGISDAITQSSISDARTVAFWGAGGRLCPAATRAEGLAAAAIVANRAGKNDAAFEFLSYVERAVAYCASFQVLDGPPACVGGFHGSPTSGNIRIDFVQHAIGAMRGLLGARHLIAMTGCDATDR